MLGERVQARKSLGAPEPHVGDYFNSLLSVIVRRCELEVDLAFCTVRGMLSYGDGSKPTTTPPIDTFQRGWEESKSSKRSVYLLFDPTVIDLVHVEVQNGKASAAKLYYDRFITNVFTKINKAFINQILERFVWSGDYSPSFCQIKLRFIGEMVFDFQRIRSRMMKSDRVVTGDILFEDKEKEILADCDSFNFAVMDIR